MSIHTPITKQGIFFITFTNHGWLPLIEITNGYDLIYKWFDILKGKGNAITGFVIMPNHLHMLLYYRGGWQSLNTIIGNGKRFMAYDIADRLIKQDQHEIVDCLQKAVKPKDRARGKIHQVWKDSFDVKECRTEEFIMQKLNYIHNNPCSGKWRLAVDPIHYLHSSASFYISGKKGVYEVEDYRNFMGLGVGNDE